MDGPTRLIVIFGGGDPLAAALPPGYAYVIDRAGNYVTDRAGNYVIMRTA